MTLKDIRNFVTFVKGQAEDSIIEVSVEEGEISVFIKDLPERNEWGLSFLERFEYDDATAKMMKVEDGVFATLTSK